VGASRLRVKWLFYLTEWGRYIEKNEHADSNQSFNSRISASKESVIQCGISKNYDQPSQLVVESQRIKSYSKSRVASNSFCIFLEKNPCLRRATKIFATEVGQVRWLQHQMATDTWGIEAVHLSESETNTSRVIVTAPTEDAAPRQLLAETQKQGQCFDGTLERKPTNQRNRPREHIHYRIPYIKKQVSVKMITRSLRSRRALEETEEATAINLTSVIPMCYWIYTKCRFYQSNTSNFIVKNTFKATCFGSTEPSSSHYFKNRSILKLPVHLVSQVFTMTVYLLPILYAELKT